MQGKPLSRSVLQRSRGMLSLVNSLFLEVLHCGLARKRGKKLPTRLRSGRLLLER